MFSTLTEVFAMCQGNTNTKAIISIRESDGLVAIRPRKTCIVKIILQLREQLKPNLRSIII